MKRLKSHQPGDETLAVKASNEKKEENDPPGKKSYFVPDRFKSKSLPAWFI